MDEQSHKKRVLACINYKGFDRIPVKHSGTPEINKELTKYFCISDYDDLLEKLGDDFRSVSPVYKGPELKKYPDGSWEGEWGERYNNVSFGKGTYPESVFLPFKDVTDVSELKKFRFPSSEWFDYSAIKGQCGKLSDYAVTFGNAGILDFMNGIARCRGVEQVLYDVADEEPVFLELVEKRFQYHYEMTEKALKSAGGLIDIVHMGEDLGSQKGPIINPEKFDKLFKPKFKAFFDMTHEYNARVMMHSCGSVRKMIPRLIDIGLDILDVVQVDAAGMNIRELHDEFYGKICFCGSISVQSTLPFGKKADVEKEVLLRVELFKDGGLILGPTHDIQVGTPVENILTMYRAAGSLK